MTITFHGLVSTLATGYKAGRVAYNWLTDSALKKDFQRYLGELETRRVLYAEWRYEDVHAVLVSLSQILQYTRKFRADHLANRQASNMLGGLIKSIQVTTDTIHGCNMHSTQGEYMAYRALVKLRTDFARTLAIFCGMLDVNPQSSTLEKFIMDMAVVRPRA